MTGTLAIYRTTVGKKVIMAVSGLILVGFVVVHMIGNLKIFDGPEHLNDYAAFLRSAGYPLVPHEGVLWIARIVLLAAVGLHIWSAYELSRISMTARPSKYGRKQNVQATYASLTMRYGGLIILLFVIYHILHLTVGVAHSNFNHENVYANVVIGFQNPLVSGFYILAMVALCFHLYHGVWSMFQTLGLNSRRYNNFWRGVAIAVAAAVAIGNISIPLAVLTGIVTVTL